MSIILREKLATVPYITSTMLTQLKEVKDGSVRQWTSRQLARGELLKIKRGLYMSRDYYWSARQQPHFVAAVSQLIEPQSYLTGAYVLQRYSVLSESVFSVTAATSKHAKVVHNQIATFEYTQLKQSLFTGFQQVWSGQLWGFEASLAKALFDYFYWRTASPHLRERGYSLIEDERLNLDLWTLPEQLEFEMYAKLAKSPKMSLIAKQLKRACEKRGTCMKKPLKLPKFKSAAEESAYWSGLDLTDHFDAGDFQRVSFPNLKPTSQPVSIRMPEHLLVRLKEKANALNVPYQALMKQYIEKGLLLRDGS